MSEQHEMYARGGEATAGYDGGLPATIAKETKVVDAASMGGGEENGEDKSLEAAKFWQAVEAEYAAQLADLETRGGETAADNHDGWRPGATPEEAKTIRAALAECGKNGPAQPFDPVEFLREVKAEYVAKHGKISP